MESLCGYSDSEFASDRDDGRSTTGHILKSRRLRLLVEIEWSCHLLVDPGMHKAVSACTPNAKYLALKSSCWRRNIIYILQQPYDYGERQESNLNLLRLLKTTKLLYKTLPETPTLLKADAYYIDARHLIPGKINTGQIKVAYSGYCPRTKVV